MDYNLIINRLKNHYGFHADKELCEFLGIKQNLLTSWRTRNTANLELITTKCRDVDLNWLFRGEKLSTDTTDAFAEPSAQYPTFNNSGVELLQFYKAEYERKCKELEEANARVDKLIDKIGCAVSQNNVKGNNFNN